MNTTIRIPSPSSQRQAKPSLPPQANPTYVQQRTRDFGVGYGRSSGYASGRRYADNWGNALFRCG